jgi:hypothetical protein
MQDDISVEMVVHLAEIANLTIPVEDLEAVATGLTGYRKLFRPLEGLELTGVTPLLDLDPRWA